MVEPLDKFSERATSSYMGDRPNPADYCLGSQTTELYLIQKPTLHTKPQPLTSALPASPRLHNLSPIAPVADSGDMLATQGMCSTTDAPSTVTGLQIGFMRFRSVQMEDLCIGHGS